MKETGHKLEEHKSTHCTAAAVVGEMAFLGGEVVLNSEEINFINLLFSAVWLKALVSNKKFVQ